MRIGVPGTEEDDYVPGQEDYRSVYRTGYEGPGHYAGQDHGAVENELKWDWQRTKAVASLAWDKAGHGVRAAWHRMERGMPGDADGHGR